MYKNTIYKTDNNGEIRYILGKYDIKPLCFFGINPSVATMEKNDKTISIVSRTAQLKGYDGYIMFNICPLRSTNINSLPKEMYSEDIVEKNIDYIRLHINDGDVVVAMWGSNIFKRIYFIEILEKINNVIKEKNAKWICLSKTKYGHPSHTRGLSYEKMTFENFDMDKYIDNLKQDKRAKKRII